MSVLKCCTVSPEFMVQVSASTERIFKFSVPVEHSPKCHYKMNTTLHPMTLRKVDLSSLISWCPVLGFWVAF